MTLIKLDHKIFKNQENLSVLSLQQTPTGWQEVLFLINLWCFTYMGGCAFSHLLRKQRKMIQKLEKSPESLAPASCVNLDKAFNSFVYYTVKFLQLYNEDNNALLYFLPNWSHVQIVYFPVTFPILKDSLIMINLMWTHTWCICKGPEIIC